ncbi:glomulin [Rana temporaria]|uniref:glomulin n=1 Tax=Rana temporaria TaxID=8407 RepID=UPI001AAD2B5D|nr:glomulin [Rana temporaria]XP_040215966.1 glomulin [Rana temporaria]
MATDLQVLVQKFQNLSEDDLNEEDTNVFLVTCQKCLEEEQLTAVLEIIQDERNQAFIRNTGWNLIGPITKCMFTNEPGSDKEKTCLQMINDLIQRCNPKEILLGILEQVDEATGDLLSRTILALLQPLQTVLLKLANKMSYSVGLSLSTVHSRISYLPVPYTVEQIKEDKHSLCQCCLALLQFIQPFVDLVSQTTDITKEQDIQEMRKELLTFCFSCLKFPLLTAHLKLEEDELNGNPFFVFAEGIMGFLVSLGEPLPKAFMQNVRKAESLENEDTVPEKEIYTAETVACLSYLLFVHHIGMDAFPFVFGPTFVLKSNMEHIDVLLKRTEESVSSKGLELLEHSLLRVDNESLHEDLLDIKAVGQVLQDLVKVMTLCPIEHLRKKSLTMLQLVIDKFCVEGKYKLFRCLLKTSNHSGLEGYTIQNIKNQIDLALKAETQNRWFLGTRLTPLLHMVLLLPEGAETDLLQNSDRIMASLNLLRYLVIKDDEFINETGVWTELQKIELRFLRPLHTGLNMSRAHYEAEIKNTIDKKKGPHSKTVCSMSAGGTKLPDMTPEMQLQVLQSALFTFDLMESVLARVEELIEVKLKSAPEEKIGSSKDV